MKLALAAIALLVGTSALAQVPPDIHEIARHAVRFEPRDAKAVILPAIIDYCGSAADMKACASAQDRAYIQLDLISRRGDPTLRTIIVSCDAREVQSQSANFAAILACASGQAPAIGKRPGLGDAVAGLAGAVVAVAVEANTYRNDFAYRGLDGEMHLRSCRTFIASRYTSTSCD